jgi:hypothetical protein
MHFLGQLGAIMADARLLQCAAAIIAGRIVPVEKGVSFMGITRWITRYFCFHAASGSLRYGDTADAAETMLRSSGDHKGDKQVLPLKDRNCRAANKKGKTPWVVSEFTIDRPSSSSSSHSMLLRKESAGSGVWFDALYSVISGFIDNERAWGGSPEQLAARYSAWCTASLEMRLHASAQNALKWQSCIAAVDGGSMKMVSIDDKQKLSLESVRSRCADRNAVLSGVYFTPASTVSLNPSWGVIVSNVHLTNAQDMYAYGKPVSIALKPIQNVSAEGVAAALTSAVMLRSKPAPDIKVEGDVKIWIYETGVRYDAKILKGFKARLTSLVLEGRTFSTADQSSEWVSIYLSHCTGILPVTGHPRHDWMFVPIPAGQTARGFHFVKIANCKVVLKSTKQPSKVISDSVHADIVFQTSSLLARDQWIRKLVHFKKSSVIAPPLLFETSPPPPSALLPVQASVQPSPVPAPAKPSAATHHQQKSSSEPVEPPPPPAPALCVILVISNPIAFRRREQLFQETLARMLAQAKHCPSLCIVSVRLTYKPNAAAGICRKSHGKRQDLQYVDLHVETTPDDVLWAKENLVNLGMKWAMADALLGTSVEVQC